MNSALQLLVDDRLNRLCKPPGSLGALETLARQLCICQQTGTPQTTPRRAVIFAADHGVVCEGVSAWPSTVTAMVVDLMLQQRTASGVFARHLNCDYQVVDAGLLRPPRPLRQDRDQAGLSANAIDAIDGPQRRCTANLRTGAAMSEADFDRMWEVGAWHARSALADGCRLVIGGEMGIGNTTSASCLISLLTGTSTERIVGRGAGIDDASLARKHEVVLSAVLRVHALGDIGAKRIAYEVGGLEIVALAGFYAVAAELGLTILLDGFISTSAALIAEALSPGSRRQMIAAHRSTEPGHMAALKHLQLNPLLDLNLRLGEATGAFAALPLLDLAAAMINQMATLDELQES